MVPFYRIALAVLLVLPVSVDAQTPALNTVAPLKVGDFGALFLNNLLEMRNDLRDPAIITYEADPGVIDVEIIGDPVTVERAKETVGKYWDFIVAAHIPYMQKRFGVTLNQMSYRIMYLQRDRTGIKVLLTFSGGQYMMAP